MAEPMRRTKILIVAKNLSEIWYLEVPQVTDHK